MAVKEFRLQHAAFEKAAEYIKTEGRDIDQLLFNYHFKKAKPVQVVETLRSYKNPDGGFGKGLEMDYFYTGSTPQSTLLGLQVLHQLNLIGNFNIISDALDYLYQTREKHAGWYGTIPEVNTAPRAPWWHHDKIYLPKFTLNPTAEIVGYFYHFGGGEYRLFVNELLDLIKDYLRDERNGNEMHEVIGLMRMVRLLPDSRSKRFVKYLKPRVDRKICLKTNRWHEYVLSPLLIFETPYDPLYTKYENYVQEHLNYLVDTQSKDGYWEPNWRWGDEEIWEQILPMIRAHLTLKNLILLKNYRRIK